MPVACYALLVGIGESGAAIRGYVCALRPAALASHRALPPAARAGWRQCPRVRSFAWLVSLSSALRVVRRGSWWRSASRCWLKGIRRARRASCAGRCGAKERRSAFVDVALFADRGAPARGLAGRAARMTRQLGTRSRRPSPRPADAADRGGSRRGAAGGGDDAHGRREQGPRPAGDPRGGDARAGSRAAAPRGPPRDARGPVQLHARAVPLSRGPCDPVGRGQRTHAVR